MDGLDRYILVLIAVVHVNVPFFLVSDFIMAEKEGSRSGKKRGQKGLKKLPERSIKEPLWIFHRFRIAILHHEGA